jgi:hypothetical protein
VEGIGGELKALIDKPIIPYFVQEIPLPYETCRAITGFARAC